MAQLSPAGRAAQVAAQILEAATVLTVECNVCHTRGVIDLGPEGVEGGGFLWQSVECMFTADCIGHVWPDAAN